MAAIDHFGPTLSTVGDLWKTSVVGWKVKTEDLEAYAGISILISLRTTQNKERRVRMR